MDTPWFKLLPDRYNAELKDLEQLDIAFKEDEDMMANGFLRLRLCIDAKNPNFNLPDKDITYELIAVFPESYPWFRPEVYAYDLNLPRHQHLLGKNLCLLNRGTSEWDPTETLANLLQSQLDEVLQKGVVTDYEIIKADPREQAEPYSEYFKVATNAPVLFDSSAIPEIDPPTVLQEIGKISLGIAERSTFPCRMAVVNTKLTVEANTLQLNAGISNHFSYKHVEGILIVTATHPPITNSADSILKWLREEYTKAGKKFTPPNSNIKLDNGGLDYVIGICFPEEVRKGVSGMGWIFFVAGSVRERPDKKAKDAYYLAKTAYVGPGVSKERVPRLLPLAKKTISICGLGALGSFVAVELARCGVGQLHLIDFDIVDPPTTVRWPIGTTAAGIPKTIALQKFINENYPYTKVEFYTHKFGSHSVDGKDLKLELGTTDSLAVEFLCRGSDLLIDATAEEGVTHFLTRIGVRKGLPHIVLYATPGAWGGVVMRWLPELTEGCWNCMKHWQTENPELLVPPVDDQGLVQPPGCGDVTFTGASFDLQQLSTAAVRMAVSTLCSQEEGGYARIEDDWAVLQLVVNNGQPIFPKWQSQKLLRHQNCGYCAKK